MKKCYPFLFALFYVGVAAGQVDLSYGFRHLDAPFWDLLLGKDETLFKNGYSVGAGVQLFRSSERWRLVPSASFSEFRREPMRVRGGSQTHARILQLRAPLRWYPMSYFDHCNCPPFNNGFFLEGSLNWNRFDLSFREPDMHAADRAEAFGWGFGAGLELAYADWLIITPQFLFQGIPSIRWEGLGNMRDPQTDYFFREETFVRKMGFEIHVLLLLYPQQEPVQLPQTP